MEDHIPIRPDRSLLLGRQASKWSLWDMVFHENYSTCINIIQGFPENSSVSLQTKILSVEGFPKY